MRLWRPVYNNNYDIDYECPLCNYRRSGYDRKKNILLPRFCENCGEEFNTMYTESEVEGSK